MTSKVLDGQLSDAVFRAVQDGLYPEGETIVSAELPSSAFDSLLELLEKARAEVKTSIRELSRLSAPDIDGWVSQARQLRTDIDASQYLAQEVVSLANKGHELQSQAEDAYGKVDLLKGEVIFNKTLSSTLQQVHDLRHTLDTAQNAAIQDNLPDAIALLKKADRELSELHGCENTRLAGLVRGKVAGLHKLVAETLTKQWNTLIHIDTNTSTISFHRKINDDPSIDIDTVVAALSALGLLRGKIMILRKAFDNVILTPRLQVQPDGTRSSWTIHEDDIGISGTSLDSTTNTLISDMNIMIDYISTKLPPSLAVLFCEVLLPGLTARLVAGPLSSSVPADLDGISAFKETLSRVSGFAETLQAHGLQGRNTLVKWTNEAPQVWLKRRSELSLHSIRQLLVRGLGDPRTVERIETQVVTRDDNLFVDPTNNEDWNAGWSDEDGEAKRQKTASTARKTVNGHEGVDEEDEEGVSAWGLDEDEDHNTTGHLSEGPVAEEDEGEAWGWGDDNEEEKAPRSPNTQSPKRSRQRINGTNTTEAPAKRQVTLKENYTITALPEQILEIIIQAVSDAEALLRTDPTNNPVAPAAEGLFALPGLLLSMYRASAPSFYAHNMSGSMYLYNDSLYMAEQLRLFVAHRAERSSNADHNGSLILEPDMSALELFGKRSYGKEMESQRTILGDLLDGAQGFTNCTEHPFAQECDLAISSTVDRLREVYKRWKPVLSHSALLQSIGSLLSTVIKKIIVDIEDMSDISEPESQQLTSFCNRIVALEDLFLPEQATELDEQAEQPIPRTAVYTPQWLKFQYLTNILESSLVDIKYLWTEGELSLEFKAEEVIDLIEALFADSEHRRRAISEIRRSAFTTHSYATCATVGGVGPYNVSQIQGYLLYTVPNGTAPAVPLLNATASSATAGPSALSATIAPFTGAAGGMAGTLWEWPGFVTVVATIGLVLSW
ncbi:hypothetical protein MMC17_000533 [Xylographa soralifera]|nr:hypothetical protein [Xylographa soralifera]